MNGLILAVALIGHPNDLIEGPRPDDPIAAHRAFTAVEACRFLLHPQCWTTKFRKAGDTMEHGCYHTGKDDQYRCFSQHPLERQCCRAVRRLVLVIFFCRNPDKIPETPLEQAPNDDVPQQPAGNGPARPLQTRRHSA